MSNEEYAHLMEGQDLLTALQQEEEAVKMYCTKCDINWKFLGSDQNDERGEEYFFCPQCKTDQHLVSKETKEKYYKSMLTGKVINFETGLEKEAPVIPIPPCPVKPFDPNLFELMRSSERIKEKQQKEDKALDEYTRLYEEGKTEEAQQVYFKILRSK